MTQIPVAQLSGLSLFQGLTTDEINTVAAACTSASFTPGQVILQEGESLRALWILLEGTVEVDLEVPKAGDRPIAELHAPSIFGETSFFHAGPHSATVKSVGASRLLRLERAKFDQLVSEKNTGALRLGIKAAEILAARLQQTDRWVEQMLESQMDAKIHTAWQHFREGLGHGFDKPGPFVGIGANWS